MLNYGSILGKKDVKKGASMTHKYLSVVPYLIFSLTLSLSIRANEGEVTVTIPANGSKAPSFKAHSTEGMITFPQDYAGKWVIFFSHPGDFTPVCEREVMKVAAAVSKLKRFNIDFLGLSTDSTYVHHLWKESLEKKMGGKYRKIEFPIIADTNRTISKKYGMIHSPISTDETVRAVFIIDPEGIVRTSLFYPVTNGRSFVEIRRIVQALQETDRKKVITPPEWQPGEYAIKPPIPEAIEAKKENASKAFIVAAGK